jgi:hypothetical protein
VNAIGKIRSIGSSIWGIRRNLAQTKREIAAFQTATEKSIESTMRGVGIQMMPVIRRMLADNYRASGLGRETDTLYQASVMDVQIFVTKNRFELSIPSGARYQAPKSGKSGGNVYAAAASHKYGAVRQPLNKEAGSLYYEFGAKSQRMLQRKKTAGEYGENAKRTLKKSMAKGYDKKKQTDFGVGLHYIPARRPFFQLTGDQRRRLYELQIELIEKQLKLPTLEEWKKARGMSNGQ